MNFELIFAYSVSCRFHDFTWSIPLWWWVYGHSTNGFQSKTYSKQSRW